MQTIADQMSAVVDERIATFNQTLETKAKEVDKWSNKKLRSQKQVSQDKHGTMNLDDPGEQNADLQGPMQVHTK